MTLLAALSRTRDPIEGRSISPSMLAWSRGDDPGPNGAAGVEVNRDTALGVSTVWACVSLIADSIATLPLDVITIRDGTAKPAPRPGWLDAPNPEQTMVDFKFGTVASLLLDGNAFIYTVRDRKGDVAEAWLLDPRFVQVRREFQPDGSLALNYYVMVGKGMQSPVGQFKVTAGAEMFHIVAFQPNSSWPRGVGPLDVARMMFGSGIAGQEMGGRYFQTGMNASGVIETDDSLTNDQAKQLKEDFTRANSGIRKMHLPPVLTGGATWKQIQISPEQAQFIEQRKFSVDEIARFFRVPPHMVGNLEKATSWGTGIEQQSIGFVTYTLRPWLERIEEAWTRRMLLFQPGHSFRFNVDALLRGDAAARADYWDKQFRVGAASPNDIARAEGRDPEDPDGWGAKRYFPVTMAPFGTEPIKIQKVEADEPGVNIAHDQAVGGANSLDLAQEVRDLARTVTDREATIVNVDVNKESDEEEQQRALEASRAIAADTVAALRAESAAALERTLGGVVAELRAGFETLKPQPAEPQPRMRREVIRDENGLIVGARDVPDEE